MSIQSQLASLGLLKPNVGPDLPEARVDPHLLLKLCHQGRLLGGLSVALDVKPDELWSPLCAQLGPVTQRLRILDVRMGPPFEMTLESGGLEVIWPLDNLSDLPQRLNDLFAEDASVKAAAVLGKWEDAWVFWCVEKRLLAGLLAQPFFRPQNRAQLLTFAPGSR